MSLAQRSTISEPTRDEAAGRWSAQLVVDDSDSVFFDHSVDHVPGMLMLHAIAELVERAGAGPVNGCAAGSFDLTFSRFVEKDEPAQVTIVPAAAPDSWQVTMTQSGHVVCAGTAGTLPLDRPEDAGQLKSTVDEAGPAVLAAAALVHRSRPENIVVTPLRTVPAGYAVDYRPSEVVRTKRFEDVHGPLDIVEAARQFMILLSHSVCGVDLGMRLILNRLTVRLAEPFPRAAPVRLLARQPRVNRGQLDFAMYARCGDAVDAAITWDIKAVNQAVYNRLRGAAHD
jgi:hypothetical protein